MNEQTVGAQGGAAAPGLGAPERLAYLTGLRAVAAVSVLVFHSLFLPLAGQAELWSALVAQLQDGVQVFFVLSGFLLYRTFVVAHVEGRAPPALGPYFRRRAARLFPAYWLCLIVTAVVFGQLHIDGVGAWVRNLLLVQAYSLADMQGSLLITWTLCVEVAFYVFLPFFAFGVRGLGRRVGVERAEIGGVVGLAVVGLLYQVVFARQGTYLPWVLLPQFFLVFSVGMGLAVAQVLSARRGPSDWFGARVARWARWTWLAVPALVVLSALRYGAYGIEAGGVRSRSIQVIGIAVAFCLVLPAVFPGDGGGVVQRFLSRRPVVYLGLVSYGIYLWHVPLINVLWNDVFDYPKPAYIFLEPVDGLVTLLVVLPVAVLVATGSWYLVERPVLRRVRRRPSFSSR